MFDFLPLRIILIGLASGLLINFISDYFYIRRKFLSAEYITEIQSLGWIIYLLFPWKASTCSIKIRIRIIIVNLSFILISIWLWFNPPIKVDYWWGMLLLVYFGVVIVMDMEYRVVLNPIGILGGIIGLLIGTVLHDLEPTLIGGVAGYLIMLGLYYLGDWMAKKAGEYRGKIIEEEALGFGDVTMAGVIGLILGWPGIIAGLTLTIVLGGIFSLLYLIIMKLLREYKSFDPIPYAPFLALSTISLLYFRDFILKIF